VVVLAGKLLITVWFELKMVCAFVCRKALKRMHIRKNFAVKCIFIVLGFEQN
jgi:hypothetical protein